MPFTVEDKAREFLEKVTEMIQDNFPAAEAEQIIGFANLFFYYVAAEDVVARGSVPDIYGAVITYWHFARDFTKNEPKIRVYNPQFEQDGWQAPHTVISLIVQDMPFLVDSIRMTINRLGLTMYLIIHPVILMRRDSDGHLLEVLGTDDHDLQQTDTAHAGVSSEAVIHVEVDHQTETERLEMMAQEVRNTLSDLQVAVADWEPMRKQMETVLHDLKTYSLPLDERDINEVYEFLRWASDSHFTFLGYREYGLTQNDNGEDSLTVVPKTGLGILRKDSGARESRSFAQLPDHLRKLARQPDLLILTKANTRATIHRPSYMDYIGIRLFNEQGEVIGEKRFLGLYTSAAYHFSTRQIPVLRRKVMNVFNCAGYRHNSHRGKSLMNILETYPRDELFQINEETLHKTAIGILQLQERQRIRLFVRPDTYGRFISCIVFVPRDRYDSAVRQEMQQMLLDSFGGDSVEFNVLLSESVLAQVHFVIRTTPGTSCTEYDVKQLEDRLIEITRAWPDMLYDALIEHTGEEHGTRLFRAYEEAFPVAYREDFSARYAVYDIERMEMLDENRDLNITLYKPIEALDSSLRLKLFHRYHHISLSEVLPMLENMGVKVLSERSYQIEASNRPCIWIQEFGLLHSEKRDLNTKELQDDFQALFTRLWRRTVENDGFNRLVLRGRMSWREIIIFRAYYHYLKQTGLSFSQLYIEQALANNPSIARILLDIFHARYNPDKTVDKETRQQILERLTERLHELLDSVSSLDEDRILQRFLAVIMATVRTNYFQKEANGEVKSYLSFKFDPSKVPDLPEPRPMFEIFVYSPRVEGVHLRGGKVARGGLRWSDRYEDFRTEVLGLVKAQMVKNAVIVPVGSKGGFVAKQLPTEGGREAIQQEGIACYETFISGLLDITDNLVEGEVVSPSEVVRYDDDDPYFVVAADKGTATFSDIANRIAISYGFWLGDAFASGGSAGYDHKKMGITARGAWESVKRHFRELGLDTQSEDFTVIGIGDMAGDVFGNGMLLSPHIKLVGAFNHMHIFLDPKPDPDSSFQERQRLFQLPRSTWEDYDKNLISKGGGVYSRNSKSIVLSPEVRELLGTKVVALTPNELIRSLLCTKVDLLWNGGIGTYVKASSEHNADVGDRTNDSLRVNGNELGCRVIGEGGNLGFTQLGRIEYALNGGRVYTDAMDNSGGVDCSDHEVNIKILLNAIVDNGDMTHKQRDLLLAEMTDEVAHLVIKNNYLQTQAISLSSHIAFSLLDAHARFMKNLEQHGQLMRELEFLPNDKIIAERRTQQQGLTPPEICVVLAYSKITLYDALIDSDLLDEPALRYLLLDYFPHPLPERFDTQIDQHRLRREIIATELTNKVINRAGSMFVFLLQEETGLSVPDIVRSFVASWEIFAIDELWSGLEALDNTVEAKVQLDMMLECRKLSERGARWLLRNRRQSFEIGAAVDSLKAGVQQLAEQLLGLLEPNDRAVLEHNTQMLTEQNVPQALAQRIVSLETWLSALDVVEVANMTDVALTDVAIAHFHLGTYLKLHWLRDHIGELPREDRWTALSRSALRDELYRTHRELTISLLQCTTESSELSDRIEEWTQQHQHNLTRILSVLSDLSSVDKPTMPMLSVAVREVRNLL